MANWIGLVMTDKMVLIWSNEHRAFWRENSQGYANERAFAGKYPIDEARDICARSGWGNYGPRECVVELEPIDFMAQWAEVGPELLAALDALMGGDDLMQVGIGGNPHYVDRFMNETRETISKAKAIGK